MEGWGIEYLAGKGGFEVENSWGHGLVAGGSNGFFFQANRFYGKCVYLLCYAGFLTILICITQAQ